MTNNSMKIATLRFNNQNYKWTGTLRKEGNGGTKIKINIMHRDRDLVKDQLVDMLTQLHDDYILKEFSERGKFIKDTRY